MQIRSSPPTTSFEDVAIIIPALNEGPNLRRVLPKLPDGARVVVVDNRSTDDTTLVALSLGATVLWAPDRGYGTAVQTAFHHLAGTPPKIVVIYDADGSDPIHNIEVLVAEIRGGADLAMADRHQHIQALTRVQRWGNRLATRLIAASCKRRFADLGSLRAIRWEAVQKMALIDPTWGWNVEMNLKAVQHNLHIVEVPLPYRARTLGKSKISGDALGAIRAGARILYAVYRYRPR